MHLQANYNIDKLNSFALGSRAKYIATIYGVRDVEFLRADKVTSSFPWKILGSGTNVVIDGDIEAVVIKSGEFGIEIKNQDDHNVWLRAGAGVSWDYLVRYTVENGWWGLENLALIPGTVGAAPVQNIGAYGVEVRDTITRLQVIDLMQARKIEMRNIECGFSYRDSIFKSKYRNHYLVHQVTFRLQKESKASVQYEDLAHELKAKNLNFNNLSPKQVYQCVADIRTRKLPDIKLFPNAGSFFKNSVLTHEQLQSLLQKVPNVPYTPLDCTKYKIHVAWLIDKAGWKGYDDGEVMVSDKHALVIVNKGKGTAKDILQLARKIQTDILDKFNIHLEREVQVF